MSLLRKFALTFLLISFTYQIEWEKFMNDQKFHSDQVSPWTTYSAGVINDEIMSGPEDHPIHYTYIPSINSPETAPTAFWCMGGPGVADVNFWFSMDGP